MFFSGEKHIGPNYFNMKSSENYKKPAKLWILCKQEKRNGKQTAFLKNLAKRESREMGLQLEEETAFLKKSFLRWEE